MFWVAKRLLCQRSMRNKKSRLCERPGRFFQLKVHLKSRMIYWPIASETLCVKVLCEQIVGLNVSTYIPSWKSRFANLKFKNRYTDFKAQMNHMKILHSTRSGTVKLIFRPVWYLDMFTFPKKKREIVKNYILFM